METTVYMLVSEYAGKLIPIFSSQFTGMDKNQNKICFVLIMRGSDSLLTCPVHFLAILKCPLLPIVVFNTIKQYFSSRHQKLSK